MAAVDYVEGRRPQPPAILEFAIHTKRWGDPSGRGWLDWPAGHPRKMAAVLDYARAAEAYRENSWRKGWVDSNGRIFAMMTEIWNWRKAAGYEVYI